MALTHKVLHNMSLLQQPQKHMPNLVYFQELHWFKVTPFLPHAFQFVINCFYATFFCVMYSTFQTEFHTLFSPLHIGLYRQLTQEEIHTEPKKITCDGFVVF